MTGAREAWRDAAERRYVTNHPVSAVLAAWAAPGMSRSLHRVTRREVGRLSPQLGRALDNLAREKEPPDRDDLTRQAVDAVSTALRRLGGDDTDDERWRKATTIVDHLVRAGLI